MARCSKCGKGGQNCIDFERRGQKAHRVRRRTFCSTWLSSSIRTRSHTSMPFENHGNRSFTAVSIWKNAPSAPGVYGLANSHQWIYVGETMDIQAELLRHLQNPHTFLKEHPPSGFTYELTTAVQRIGRQNQLVLELEPIGNRLDDCRTRRSGSH